MAKTTLEDRRIDAADRALEDYKFVGFDVEDLDGWEWTSPGSTMTRVIWIDDREASGELRKATFTVVFQGDFSAIIVECYATLDGTNIGNWPSDAPSRKQEPDPVACGFARVRVSIDVLVAIDEVPRLQDMSLNDVQHEIMEGSMIGGTVEFTRPQPLTRLELHRELLRVGNDGDFFGEYTTDKDVLLFDHGKDGDGNHGCAVWLAGDLNYNADDIDRSPDREPVRVVYGPTWDGAEHNARLECLKEGEIVLTEDEAREIYSGRRK
jgi:hypothetical protein